MNKKFLMSRQTFYCLTEALRRYECFTVRRSEGKWVLKDIQKAWTGHGSATEYKSAIESGFITYVHKPHPGFRQWWRLTEKGARVIQKWHREGHNCGKGFTLITEPNFFDYSKHNPANK